MTRDFCLLFFSLLYTQNLEESMTLSRFSLFIACKNSEPKITSQLLYGIQKVNVRYKLFKSNIFKDFFAFVA